jgi:hypothetical protein
VLPKSSFHSSNVMILPSGAQHIAFSNICIISFWLAWNWHVVWLWNTTEYLRYKYMYVFLPVWQEVTKLCISNFILFLFLLDDQTERFLNLRKKIWDNITEGEYVQYHFVNAFS